MTISGKVPVSVIVPTRDEERNIAACLASLDWADEIVVLDSHSRDRTTEIAVAHGARIVTRPFDDFATHKNWALDSIELRNAWVLLVDADERASPALAAEIATALARADACNGYYIPRRNVLWGGRLRSAAPDYNLRLLRRGKGRYENRLVHEHVLIEGPAGYLVNALEHRDEKGFERYIDRHNTYTSLEAVEIWRARHGIGAADRLKGAPFRRGPEGRRVLKTLSHRYLPLRPLFFFLYLYVVKGGVLDGRRGFRYAAIKAFFEYMIEIKLEELEDRGSALHLKYKAHLD